MSSKKSTNGRFILLRATFRALEYAAPSVGARMLDRAWFRLPVVPEHVQRLRVELPPGTPVEAALNGRTVRGTAWGSGPTVYLFHGWGGWALQLAAFVPPLLESGFRVIAFDVPSHGASDPGEFGPGTSTMPEFADALRAMIAAHGPAYGVVAHSFGAAATTLALAEGLSARRVVYLSAATDFATALGHFRRMLGFGPRIERRFRRRFIRRIGRPLETFEVVRIIDELVEERDLPSLLAIHDRGDAETPYTGSEQIAKVWPGARLELTAGLGHNRILRDPLVVLSVTDFLSTDQAVAAAAEPARETMPG
ncbi:alpha/beta fold hydrolase [Kribbella deserti]|uniref:Alpha/beta fold hydrolase n=1 Tax=Kribbella deserti TaxID=1926257 RepID=A0ABV6QEH4_9ACTN